MAAPRTKPTFRQAGLEPLDGPLHLIAVKDLVDSGGSQCSLRGQKRVSK